MYRRIAMYCRRARDGDTPQRVNSDTEGDTEGERPSTEITRGQEDDGHRIPLLGR